MSKQISQNMHPATTTWLVGVEINAGARGQGTAIKIVLREIRLRQAAEA